MPLRNVYYKMRTLPSGKKQRLAIDSNTNRVIETTPVKNWAKGTKTAKRLTRRRRRIGR